LTVSADEVVGMDKLSRASKTDRAKVEKLVDVPNVGPRVAEDLGVLKIRRPQDLIGRDPYDLYEELCRVTGKRHDPCMLDTLIAAVRFMSGEKAKPWWAYTAERKRVTKARERVGFVEK